jgi:DNA (cytosine-5)-methyltransferase 1
MPFVDWKLSELKQDKPVRVFSCFCCGGGSTMGYKLAGFSVVGGVEIDERVATVYKTNHKPKMFFVESIVDFNKRQNIPKELFNIDILDGSPPCSTFSMAGSREDKWGIKSNFREGQEEQVLDQLFFHFLTTAKILRPKVVVAENVKGMLVGDAKKYCREVLRRFDVLGYDCQLFLLNAASMNVPQTRQRVFFIARRKDLKWENLALSFNEPAILFREVFDKDASIEDNKLIPSVAEFWKHIMPYDKDLGDICERDKGKRSFFNYKIIRNNEVCSTICCSTKPVLEAIPRFCSNDEIRKISTFPMDYNTCKEKPTFLYGMSVPPRMMQRIAEQLWLQWFSKAKTSVAEF